MQGASRIFQNYHIRDLVYFLGLRQQISRGNTSVTKPIVVNRTASLGLSVLAELAAVFLAFPGGRCLQIMDESFFLQDDRTGWTSEEEEEEEGEENAEEENMQITQQDEEEMEDQEGEESSVVTLNHTPLEELIERVAAADDKKETSKKKKKKKRKTSEENEFDKEA